MMAFVSPDLSSGQDGLRDRLKQNTDDLHQAMHHHPMILKLLSRNVDAAHYHYILQHYAQFYRRIEDIRVAQNWWPQMSLAPALVALSADLAALPPMSMGAKALPPLKQVEAEEMGCLGALYVLTGASAGNKIIAKQIARALPCVPRAFFAETHLNLQWNAVVEVLTHGDILPDQYARLEAGARNTFEAFGQFLTDTAF